MLLKRIKKYLFRPVTPLTKNVGNIKRLGSNYGGWCYVELDNLNGSVLFSGGAGEDVSFELEFARKYNAKVIIIDPTPRSVAHVKSIQDRIGVTPNAEVSYNNTGEQSVESYDLIRIEPEQIILEPVALWDNNEVVNFYAPRNCEHVSHSIVNLQNTNSLIKVDGVTLDSVIDKYHVPCVELFKLDIEGAEIEVLSDMLNKSINPRQILVEFDEINYPGFKSKRRVEKIYNMLTSSGYDLVHISNGSDYCFLLSK